ncbi:MAG: GxxExxY protein [Kiritimatiellales bacterium]|nr:GxxExxY protein [Kiritimatiellota bacterium]MBL7015939.1 GxxExxY protein [Kiritimatiellales bacterium]
MTVKYTQPPIQRSQDEFNEIDYQVMGQAFDLHNNMGNLWDEREYRHQLAVKCTAIGLKTFEEVHVSISHNGFCKNYFIDLLINGNIYELKTATAITKNHEAQTINYLFLANTLHGKIINFRPDSLKWRFVSTSLTATDRALYSLRTSTWNPQTKSALKIPTLLNDLLDAWGACLSTNLYKEALCHFLNIHLENEHQRFTPLSPNTVFHMSGLSAQKNNLRNNLQKYLNTSRFDELLWINFDQTQIELSCLHHSA